MNLGNLGAILAHLGAILVCLGANLDQLSVKFGPKMLSKLISAQISDDFLPSKP